MSSDSVHEVGVRSYCWLSVQSDYVRRALQVTVRTHCMESIGFVLFSVLPSSAISDWPFAGFMKLRVKVPYTVRPARLSFH